MKKIVIMGFGDVLKGDMGAGCTALEKMAETVTGDDIEFAYMGRETRFAASYLLEADLAVITAALDLSGLPGTLHVWSQAVFDSHVEWMAEGFPEIRGLATALAETKLVGGFPKHLVFIWMTPHLTEGYGISELMQTSVIRAVWQIHREIWRIRLSGQPFMPRLPAPGPPLSEQAGNQEFGGTPRASGYIPVRRPGNRG